MKRLYHYTSTNSLKNILQTQKLRFNNLTAMDDPEEAKSFDSYNAGRWIFTSSWTDLRDNERMFEVYGNQEKGVWISLPEYPFYTVTGNPLFENRIFMKSFDSIQPVEYTRGTEEYIKKYNLIFMPTKVKEVEINYTNKDDLLYPKVTKSEENSLKYFDGTLGKYKDLKWSYQHEIRYRLSPSLFNDFHHPRNRIDFENMILSAIYTKISDKCPIEHIDIPIKLRNIEIIFGNKVTLSEKKEIQKLTKRFCANPILVNSKITY